MRVEVLGNVQDGGIPHLGCDCDLCEAAREGPREQKYVCSLLLRENGDEDTVRYLIDATPDMRAQIRGEYLDGVFIAHANLGHITGLLFLGEEGRDADHVSVHCNQDVQDYVMKNDPYRLLVDRGNIQLHDFEDGEQAELQGGKITAESHHHPQIGHPTTGYFIEGEEKTLYYLSDITGWNDQVIESVRNADIAIIDGTFWSEDEIDRYDEVPHPTIKSSMDRMEDFETDIYFTHLNHTNPVLREDSDEREELEERGFRIVERGMEFEL